LTASHPLREIEVHYGDNGVTLPYIQAELEGIGTIDPTSMNAFEDPPTSKREVAVSPGPA
jgi:hypothetical protein